MAYTEAPSDSTEVWKANIIDTDDDYVDGDRAQALFFGLWIDGRSRDYNIRSTFVYFNVLSYFNSEYFRMDFPLRENEELPFKRIEMSLSSQPYDHIVEKSLFELEYRYQKD